MILLYIYVVFTVVQAFVSIGLCYGHDVLCTEDWPCNEKLGYLSSAKWLCVTVIGISSLVPFLGISLVLQHLNLITINTERVRFILPFGIRDRKLMRSINPELQQRLDL